MMTAKYIVLAAVILSVAGCGTARLFRTYEFEESASVADTPYPRLADTPDAPQVGTFTREVPDPAVGVATIIELRQRAAATNAERERLSAPVIDDAARARLNSTRQRAH